MLSLLSTPSGGQNEILRALVLENDRLTSEGGVAYNRLLRHLPPRIDTSDIPTILSTLEGLGYVQSDGSGGYEITATGRTYARSNGLRRSRISVQ